MAREARNWRDDLDQAQELVWEAWGASTARERRSLAAKAVAISPVCADAYGILATEAKRGSDAAIELWHTSLAAGRAALGLDFGRYEGEFWGYMETRPYMRALFGVAWALCDGGRKSEAVNHLQEMLRLNPNDNQGARYILASWLLDLDRDEPLSDLLSRYGEDDMASWRWTAALAGFRKDGDTADNRALLEQAVEANPHILAVLTGAKRLPAKLPQAYSPGSIEEAQVYLSTARSNWEKTTAALGWLGALKPPASAPTRKKKPGG